MVYLEPMLAMNFAANLSLMAVCGRLCQRKAVWWRYALTALILSFGGILFLLPVRVPKFIVGTAMVGAAGWLGWKCISWRQWVRQTLVLLGCTFLAGGIAFAAAQFAQSNAHFPVSGAIMAVLAIVGSAVVFLLIFRSIDLRRVSGQCRVRFWVGEKMVEADALIDTGNRLKDPSTGLAVMLLAPQYAYLLKDVPGHCIHASSALGMQILPCIEAEKLEIDRGTGWKPALPLCIAISERKSFAGQDALLPAQILW